MEKFTGKVWVLGDDIDIGLKRLKPSGMTL